MMPTSISRMLLSLFIIGFAIPLYAKRHSRRQGNISQALQSPNQQSFDFNKTLKVANVDRLSDLFDEKGLTKQIQQSAEVETGIPQPSIPPSPVDKPTAKKKTAPAPDEKTTAALKGVEDRPEEDEYIELQFEDADLQNFVNEMAELFNVTFISDDIIDPLPKGTGTEQPRAIKGNKITFKTNKPLTRKDAWDLFITFLDIAGFAVVPQPDPSIYRIQVIKSAQRAPLPTYLGVNPETLPDNDQLIRYLYFIENASVDSMKGIIDSLRSTSADSPILLSEHKAFIITDKSYNIKSLMKIVKELDKVTMPQAMTVLKLRQVDADDVRKLYEELTQTGEGANKSPFQPWGSRKQPTGIYFPENARIIAEPRTNSLILLGPKDAIAKIEEFITKYIDVELDQPYSPLFSVQLQYADAKVVAEIMNNTTKIGQNTPAGQSGGVRGRDKYLRQMAFTPEPKTNKIIVRGDYEDYLMAKNIIEQLDSPQPQVALDVLIITVDMVDQKEVGTALRSKISNLNIPGLSGLTGNNVVFQTSGLRAGQSPQGIVTNNDGPGFDRLLGNLLKLVTQAPAGNTIVTFGQDLFGVWGLFQVLRIITDTQVISNPFLIASNKTPATVSLGETRRVVASRTITGTAPDVQGFTDDEASLKVDITPQINSDGMILLNLVVNLTEFTDPDPTSGNKVTKLVKTSAILADKEVLALGGLVREKTTDGMSKTPILGDIPVFGWLFKNQARTKEKSNILILISAKIIPPNSTAEIKNFTNEHLQTFQLGLEDGVSKSDKRDPIHKIFFEDRANEASVKNTLFERHERDAKKNSKKKKKKKKELEEERLREELQKDLSLVQHKQPATQPASPALPLLAMNNTPAQAPILTSPQPTSAKSKKRSSQSLSNFLSTSEKEKQV